MKTAIRLLISTFGVNWKCPLEVLVHVTFAVFVKVVIDCVVCLIKYNCRSDYLTWKDY